jgi:hypothetical protein
MAAAYGGDESYAQKVIAKLSKAIGGSSRSASFADLNMSELQVHGMPPDGDCLFSATIAGVRMAKGGAGVNHDPEELAAHGARFRQTFLDTVELALKSRRKTLGMDLSTKEILVESGRIASSSI